MGKISKAAVVYFPRQAVSWPYIAGFFDGEGYLGIQCERGSGSLRISIAQSGDIGYSVLEDIQVFLDCLGVKSKIYSRRPIKGKVAYVLAINSRSDVVTFLRGVLPHLRVKRVLAQDLIRHTLIFPMFNASQREFVLKEARGY